ncbi:hypothetical protein PVK06_034121 [Gossypium arboreum]|uniref:Uncharacterized protein n=1 Tax=Gossypium arboreum TaxID=29729 RepID=A0ABR0ND96_GOSAR|nr:hypothetical protein PVK06_034121 [Gossypium arboreum]
MGGPLGEVLANMGSNAGTCRNSSALSLLSEGWSGSPHARSSLSTGLLQTTPFRSLSDISSGNNSGNNSIYENNKSCDRASLCDDVLSSTLVSSTLIPSVIRS